MSNDAKIRGACDVKRSRWSERARRGGREVPDHDADRGRGGVRVEDGAGTQKR